MRCEDARYTRLLFILHKTVIASTICGSALNFVMYVCLYETHVSAKAVAPLTAHIVLCCYQLVAEGLKTKQALANLQSERILLMRRIEQNHVSADTQKQRLARQEEQVTLAF